MIESYIKEWESKGYEDGIPDEAHPRIEHLNKAPSYRRIVKAILSNDLNLESLGRAKPKSSVYSQLKRIELIERNGEFAQIDLFFD